MAKNTLKEQQLRMYRDMERRNLAIRRPGMRDDGNDDKDAAAAAVAPAPAPPAAPSSSVRERFTSVRNLEVLDNRPVSLLIFEARQHLMNKDPAPVSSADLADVLKVPPHELRAGAQLCSDLQESPLLEYNERSDCWSYRSKHNLRCKDDLLAWLRAHWREEPTGIPAENLSDAYRGAKDDIDQLVREGLVFSLVNPTDKKTMLFWDELAELDGGPLRVSDDVRDMWHGVTLPKTTADLEQQMASANLERVVMSTTGRKRRR